MIAAENSHGVDPSIARTAQSKALWCRLFWCTSIRANMAKAFIKFVRFDCASKTAIGILDQEYWYLDYTLKLDPKRNRESEMSVQQALPEQNASCRAHPSAPDFAWLRRVCQDTGKVAMFVALSNVELKRFTVHVCKNTLKRRSKWNT